MNINENEINFIKQDIRDLQKKLDAILKRLDQVEANTVPADDHDDCACRSRGPCQCE